MEYQEYMESLKEQIQDKRAKRLVETEIKNHIEEQAECYELEGMEPETALKEAVLQMGDPIETGMALNRIHKPKMPWMMLLLAVVLMVASVVMQAIIFSRGGNVLSAWANLPRTIFYNLIGFSIILVLLYLDYHFIAKYAYVFYALFLAGLPLFLILVGLLRKVGRVTPSTAYYGIQMLFPILMAGVIYQNRGRGLKGILTVLVLSGLELIWYGVSQQAFGCGSWTVAPALAESILILGIMLLLAIWKGIFGKENRKQIGFLVLAAGVLVFVCVLLFEHGIGLQVYAWERIKSFLHGGANNYLSNLIRTSIEASTWSGNRSFFLEIPNSEIYNSFLLNSIFTYFGKIAGAAVIIVYVVFLGAAFYISVRQSNRIGFLVGIACTVSIFVRLAAYLAINFGHGLWWTTLVPFLSYGRVSAVMNGIYIGLILCVYRNSNILREEKMPQKRIRIVVE